MVRVICNKQNTQTIKKILQRDKKKIERWTPHFLKGMEKIKFKETMGTRYWSKSEKEVSSADPEGHRGDF